MKKSFTLIKEIGYTLLFTSCFYFLYFVLFPKQFGTVHTNFLPVLLDIIALVIISIVLWKCNIKIDKYLDRFIRWEERPGKRLVLEIVVSFFAAIIIAIIVMIPNAIITHMFYPQMLTEFSYERESDLIHSAVYYYFVILIVFNGFYIGSSFYKRWMKASIEAERLKYENVHAHLHALQNQAQPHFLFNTLNTLTSLIEEDKNTAIEFVQQMAAFYRYLLQREENHLVRLDEELHFVSSYIFLQKKRFGENLQINISVNPELNEKLIPTYVLLILFENAVKHNIVSSENPLRINVHGTGDSTLIVENNIQLKSSTAPSTGYGLNNIKHRYEILSDKKIVIEQNETSYKVILPLLSEEKFPNESTNN